MGLRYSTYLDPNDEIESIYSSTYNAKNFGDSYQRLSPILINAAGHSRMQPHANIGSWNEEEEEEEEEEEDENIEDAENYEEEEEEDDDDDDNEEEDAEENSPQRYTTVYTPPTPPRLSNEQIPLISRGMYMSSHGYSYSSYNPSAFFAKPTSSLPTSRSIPFYKTHSKYNDDGKAITYGCKDCLTHLSSSNLIISDKYHGITGDALLIEKVVNILLCQPELKNMTTGCYTVCDIKCHQCMKLLGWKYLKAYEFHQKFKENRYILEINNIRQVR